MSEAAEAQMPVFPDLESGQAYLSSLMLANPLAAEQQLTLFLESLLAEPPDPGILLQLLELLFQVVIPWEWRGGGLHCCAP